MRMRRLAAVVAVAVMVVGPVGAGRAADVVRITSEASGLMLSVIEDGPLKDFVRMEPANGKVGQNWIWLAGHDSFSKLQSTLRGLCLDVVNGGERDNFLHVMPCENFSGQFITLSTTKGTWSKMMTEFRGLDMCMDVVAGNMVQLMPCNGSSSQNWDEVR